MMIFPLLRFVFIFITCLFVLIALIDLFALLIVGLSPSSVAFSLVAFNVVSAISLAWLSGRFRYLERTSQAYITGLSVVLAGVSAVATVLMQ
jgi:hypothetical protein